MPGPAPRLLVVGGSGFIARALLAAAEPGLVRAMSHGEFDRTDLLDGTRCVIGCARHPKVAGGDYDLERDDPDIRLARQIGGRPVRYLMLSTRKVYAPASGPLGEGALLGPLEPYGRNRLAVEGRLRDLLGERLVVLRLANVFGFELEPGRRTFLATLLRTLKETGQVRFDMSPFVERDFLPVERVGEIVLELAKPGIRPPPVLNVGSGIGFACGRLALHVIEGFGRGELVITRPDERDGFVLDVNRLTALVGPVIDRADLERACRALGQRLARLDEGAPGSG